MKNKMRKIISYESKLTQGSIFNNTMAEDYDHSLGLIISARCDIAHSKIKKYSYLPIIELNEWIRIDGYELAKETVEKNYFDQLKRKLKSIGKEEDVYNYIELETIRDSFFSSDKKTIVLINKIISLTNSNRYSEIDIEKDDIDKEIKNILKKLMSYTLAGYYFIEGITNKDEYYVVLLREIHFLPYRYIKRLERGFVPTENDTKKEYVRHQEETYIMGILESPFIEHLMQLFSLQYTRIGIDDFSNKESVIEGVKL